MNTENLIRFAETGKIKKEEFNLDQIENKFNLASRRIRNAELLLKNNNNDEGVFISAYSELYNSYRNLCEVMLAIAGYRTGGGKGHHEAAISTIQLTLEDEKLDSTYLRLTKMGRKRGEMEYGGNFDISIIEMEQMLNDVKEILKRVGAEIEAKKTS